MRASPLAILQVPARYFTSPRSLFYKSPLAILQVPARYFTSYPLAILQVTRLLFYKLPAYYLKSYPLAILQVTRLLFKKLPAYYLIFHHEMLATHSPCRDVACNVSTGGKGGNRGCL